MTRKTVIYIVLAAAIAALTYLGWKTTARGAYESAEYVVLESDGDFEIREYPPLMMATTNMQLESQGDDGSFMRLFRYIGGGNEANQKVAMTTPVFMRRDADDTGQMGFVLPSKIAEAQIPEPNASNVEIRERSGGRFAVIQFAGRINRDSVAAAEKRLRNWMTSRGLPGEEEIESAGYDAPWTPGPLRRNEVLIRLQ